MSAFRASFPITATSFINRCGTIGLNLLPMVLVQRAVSSGDSALVMGTVRACALLGVLLGGWICDRFGLRAALLWSFILSGVGMAPIPWVHSLVVLTVVAGLSQLGSAMYTGSSRLLITDLVPSGQQQEAIAWQRTAVNLGQIVSYSIGAAASGLGTTVLFVFDSFTSFLAAALGMKLVPRRPVSSAPSPQDNGVDHADPGGTWADFVLCAAAVAGFVFLFEMFMVGASARCAVVFGDDGLRIFSLIMVLNTVLCTLLSVVASRVLTRGHVALPAGIVLVAVGASLVFMPDAGRTAYFLGTLVLTLGEIVFAAVGPFLLLKVTPPGRHRGSIYSTALLIQMLGKVAGGYAAFPLIVNGEHPLAFIWACGVVVAVLGLVGPRIRGPSQAV